MYLATVTAENFRIFGAKEKGAHLDVALRPGLNVIVGENDGGKSGLVDAIRLTLGTTAHDYYRLTEDDFHVEGGRRAQSMVTTCVFRDLTINEEAAFLEYLDPEPGGTHRLIIRFEARIGDGGRVHRSTRAGPGPGGSLDEDLREFLAATYLRPLRDAEGALSGGRGSRLAQLLDAHPEFVTQRADDFDLEADASEPKTLVGIMRRAEHAIRKNSAVERTTVALNQHYLSGLSLGTEPIMAGMGIARRSGLREILEKVELAFLPDSSTQAQTRRGLGLNNALFMAAELLLLGDTASEASPLLLIEEPEAHLHPQLQMQVVKFLKERCKTTDKLPVQTVLTTHSPTLTSKVELNAITLMIRGRTYSLAKDVTRLNESDYRFLARFLDDTKANLFFARGVLIVEGEGEQLLLPTLADLLDYSFTRHAVSVVKVGSRGLFRYSRIFQRMDNVVLPIRVACVADRDIVPRAAEEYVPPPKSRPQNAFYADEFTEAEVAERISKLQSHDGDPVRTFVSPHWTLEYDLAEAGFARELHVAVSLARRSKAGYSMDAAMVDATRAKAEHEYDTEIADLEPGRRAAVVYKPLKQSLASKAETAQILAGLLRESAPTKEQLMQRLPRYLVDTIQYVTGAASP